jgi:hypothetical protein
VTPQFEAEGMAVSQDFVYRTVHPGVTKSFGNARQDLHARSCRVGGQVQNSDNVVMDNYLENKSSSTASFRELLAASLKAIAQSRPQLLTGWLLGENYHCLFNFKTIVTFSLLKGSHVKLEAFNPFGQRIASLVMGWWGADAYPKAFDGSGFPSGSW